jgi:nucleotide-binding universal stress UspA family protein
VTGPDSSTTRTEHIETGRIVIGVDGSPGGARALRWATRSSCGAAARLVLVHVITYSVEFVNDLPPTGLTNWRRQLRHRLDSEWALPAVQAGLPVETVLHEDQSVDMGLLKIADDVDADLIVLGAHGHGDVKDRLLGAVTYRVSHQAKRPVVIVPVGWRGDQDARS